MSKREIFLPGFIAFLAMGIGFYFLIYVPATERIERANADLVQVRAAVEAGNITQILYAVELALLEEYREQWEEEQSVNVPAIFNDAEILRMTRRIVYPHVNSIELTFTPATQLESLYITNVTLSFTSTYSGLLAILNDFANEGMDNRIVTFTIATIDEGPLTGDTIINAFLNVEYLTMSPGLLFIMDFYELFDILLEEEEMYTD